MATIAFGYTGLEYLFPNRIADVTNGAALNYQAIQESMAAYNQRFNALTSQMVQDVEIGVEFFAEPTGGTLQPLDEWGNPLPVKRAMGWQNGYPIRGAGTAYGTDRLSRVMMTFQEANQFMVDAQQRDLDWNKRQLLAALFTNNAYTFFDQTRDLRYPAGLGNITVNPLANNDSVIYTRRSGAASAANHYLSQTAAISDATGANPFPTIWNTLMAYPSNYGKRVIVYAALDQINAISGLASFTQRQDRDVTAPSTVWQTTNEPGGGFGDQYIGYVRAPGFSHIVSWGDLPSGYLLATVESVAPVARRQYPVEALKGFFTEEHSPDGNREITRLLRYAGYGVRNRIGALVMQIGAASYSVPAGFQAPLAI